MDDYSRFTLAHRLQQDMTADSFIEVVQDAVDTTSMDQVPVTDRTRLLSEQRSRLRLKSIQYLGMVGIKHILATPFLYLVAIMDWHSRYVLAWRLSNTLEVDFCVAALEEALSKGRPQIFNTDQGTQFTSEAFTSMLLAQGVQVSMDGRGRCMDNVFVERLWRSIKYEEVYLKAYQNGTEARKGIGAYLAFYNQERLHQALGYRSPGQVFQAVSPQRCLLEHPQALPSDEGLRDTPAVDSLILASPLS